MKLMLPALVLVLIGLAVGTMIRPVRAQTDSTPFQIGQRVNLSYANDRSFDCTLAEVRGAFVRCEQAKPDPFARFPVHTGWFNTATTVSIHVREK